MIELRPATPDEMVLAFLQAEINTPTERGEHYAAALAQIGAARGPLIDRGDLTDSRQNDDRRSVLGVVRGYSRSKYLFLDFPNDAAWRLVTVTPTEVKGFKYAKSAGCHPLLSSTRIVADGLKNLDRVQIKEIKEISDRVANIAKRLRQGERFCPLIAAQCTGIADMVLMEGHTRATAYALTGITDVIELIIGTSSHMRRWPFF